MVTTFAHMLQPINLDRSSRDHCCHGNDKPDSHSLEFSESLGVLSQTGDERVEEATVEEDEDCDTKDVEG